tara:strand:- start:878 stop:1069 length:192 start_codon:yes stop_codon:yes gene_type:complete
MSTNIYAGTKMDIPPYKSSVTTSQCALNYTGSSFAGGKASKAKVSKAKAKTKASKAKASKKSK